MASNQALQAEVRANLPIGLAIKAADALFSHDQRTYTHILPEASHQSLADGGGKKRHDSHKKGKDSTDSKKSEKPATEDKNSKKPHGKNASRNRSRRSTSGENDLASLRSEVTELQEENALIRKELDELRNFVQKLTIGDTSLTCQKSEPTTTKKQEEKPAAADDDFDLFDSEEEEDSEEKKKVTEARLAAYAAKKAKKPGVIAKSSVILDVKPWDDETDLDKMEESIKTIVMDGLLWGASKKVPIGYGISKLQIVTTVEDEKVSVDDLIEKITDFEDFVQSVDIVAFNKI
jgi:elongation factor 1-delta